VACGPQEMAVGGSSAALLDGTEASHPYVGWLDTPKGLCTAILISASHALTAAHCVAPVGGDVVEGYLTFTLGGVDYPGHSGSVDVHPDYALNVDFDKDAVDAHIVGDLALVAFEQVIVEDHSLPLAGPPGVGEEVTQWGLGTDESGWYGTSKTGTTQVREVYDTFFLTVADQEGYAMLAPGDSGGPSFDDQDRLVGVHSFIRTPGELYSYDGGPPKTATGREALDTRVDWAAGWIQGVIAAYDGEEVDLEEPEEPEEPGPEEPACEEWDWECQGKADRTGAPADAPMAGCSVSGGAPTGLPLWCLLLLASIAILTRRRRSWARVSTADHRRWT
jgi:hypothetical protein